MRAPVALGLAGALMVALPATAAPYVAVDGNTKYIAMLDEGSLVRSAGLVGSEALIVVHQGKAVLVKFQFDCTARTWRQESSRDVNADASLSAPIVGGGPAAVAQPGSLGESLLERACFGRQVNATGGWTRATLAEAVTAARAVLVRANSQPSG